MAIKVSNGLKVNHVNTSNKTIPDYLKHTGSLIVQSDAEKNALYLQNELIASGWGQNTEEEKNKLAYLASTYTYIINYFNNAYSYTHSVINNTYSYLADYIVNSNNERNKLYNSYFEVVANTLEAEHSYVINSYSYLIKHIKNSIAEYNSDFMKIVGGAPEAFDTLKEIADWITGPDGELDSQYKTAEDIIEELKTLDNTTNANTTSINNLITSVNNITNNTSENIELIKSTYIYGPNNELGTQILPGISDTADLNTILLSLMTSGVYNKPTLTVSGLKNGNYEIGSTIADYNITLTFGNIYNMYNNEPSTLDERYFGLSKGISSISFSYNNGINVELTPNSSNTSSSLSTTLSGITITKPETLTLLNTINYTYKEAQSAYYNNLIPNGIYIESTSGKFDAGSDSISVTSKVTGCYSYFFFTLDKLDTEITETLLNSGSSSFVYYKSNLITNKTNQTVNVKPNCNNIDIIGICYPSECTIDFTDVNKNAQWPDGMAHSLISKSTSENLCKTIIFKYKLPNNTYKEYKCTYIKGDGENTNTFGNTYLNLLFTLENSTGTFTNPTNS